jgi:hypothetical protein
VGFIGIGPLRSKGHGILKIKMLAPAKHFSFKKISAILGKQLTLYK